MAVIRNKPTKIKCYRDESEMINQSTGDLTLLYEVAPGGIFIDPTNYNALHTIEVFQDEEGILHGYFKKK